MKEMKLNRSVLVLMARMRLVFPEGRCCRVLMLRRPLTCSADSGPHGRPRRPDHRPITGPPGPGRPSFLSQGSCALRLLPSPLRGDGWNLGGLSTSHRHSAQSVPDLHPKLLISHRCHLPKCARERQGFGSGSGSGSGSGKVDPDRKDPHEPTNTPHESRQSDTTYSTLAASTPDPKPCHIRANLCSWQIDTSRPHHPWPQCPEHGTVHGRIQNPSLVAIPLHQPPT
jgi:hypothetical protein